MGKATRKIGFQRLDRELLPFARLKEQRGALQRTKARGLPVERCNRAIPAYGFQHSIAVHVNIPRSLLGPNVIRAIFDFVTGHG